MRRLSMCSCSMKCLMEVFNRLHLIRSITHFSSWIYLSKRIEMPISATFHIMTKIQSNRFSQQNRIVMKTSIFSIIHCLKSRGPCHKMLTKSILWAAPYNNQENNYSIIWYHQLKLLTNIAVYHNRDTNKTR